MLRRRNPPLAVRLALVLAAAPCALAQAPDPAAPGPFAPGRVVEDVPVTGGDLLATDLHFPDDGAGGLDPAAGACPVVAFGHGFARSRARHAGFAAHLASRGFVVLVPDFAGADHSRNGDDLSALLDWALAEDERPGSRLFGRIDREALGVGGYSAGGLAAVLCAARDSRVRAAVLLDPVDSGGLGEGEIAAIRAPASYSWSEPSACNAFGSGEQLHAAAPPPKRGLAIEGGTHCDPEDPSDLGCVLICGGESEARRTLYRRHATDWLEHWLRCDESYRSWIDGADVLAEEAAGLLGFSAEGLGPPCAAARPGPVTGLRVARDGDDLLLSWDPLPPEPPVTGYRVREDESFEHAAALLVAEPGEPQVRLTGAAAEAGNRSWRVRAFGPGGEGP